MTTLSFSVFVFILHACYILFKKTKIDRKERYLPKRKSKRDESFKRQETYKTTYEKYENENFVGHQGH